MRAACQVVQQRPLLVMHSALFHLGSGKALFSQVDTSEEFFKGGPQCQVDFSPIYSITSSFVSFFLPCIIMLIIYFHLFAIAKRHLHEMR